MPNPDPLDDVAFLARSRHRVAVLDALADGAKTRRELQASTGISQPTLGRILDPFCERNWVERHGQTYALTPWGDLLAADFDALVDTVETIQGFGAIVEYLPTDEFDFDLREFGDATVTLPTPGDAFAHVRRVEELLYTADDVRNIAPTVAPGTPEDYDKRWRDFMDGDQRVEAIVSEGTMAVIEAEGLNHYFREGLEHDRIDVYRYGGEVDRVLGVADGVVILAPLNEYGIPEGVVESTNPVIRDWAHARLDAYLEASRALAPDDFAD